MPATLTPKTQQLIKAIHPYYPDQQETTLLETVLEEALQNKRREEQTLARYEKDLEETKKAVQKGEIPVHATVDDALAHLATL